MWYDTVIFHVIQCRQRERNLVRPIQKSQTCMRKTTFFIVYKTSRKLFPLSMVVIETVVYKWWNHVYQYKVFISNQHSYISYRLTGSQCGAKMEQIKHRSNYSQQSLPHLLTEYGFDDGAGRRRKQVDTKCEQVRFYAYSNFAFHHDLLFIYLFDFHV